jgi:hypothetical protein
LRTNSLAPLTFSCVFQNNAVVGLLDMDLLLIDDYALPSLVFLARRPQRPVMIGTIQT